MILSRLGNKQKLARQIIPYFPYHRNYVEMFFGAGGMFFNKEISPHNVCNDLDNDVYNLFKVVKERKEELIETFINTPIHQQIFNEWVKNHESDPIWKAIRFLVLSNFSFLGKMDTLSFGQTNTKRVLLEKLDETFKLIQNVKFMNCDFRQVISKLAFNSSRKNQKLYTFIYADPPYLDTTNNYNTPTWTEQDSYDLINICKTTELNMAISEFNNPKILEMSNGLNIIPLGEHKNLLNKRNDILITNYKIEKGSFQNNNLINEFFE